MTENTPKEIELEPLSIELLNLELQELLQQEIDWRNSLIGIAEHMLGKRMYMAENIPIKNLTLLERNPRKITKDQMAKLCKSIEEDSAFLKNRPILVNFVDGKNIVYAGNQRVRAAKMLKMKDIPCIIEKDLPEELVRKRIILDNKTFGSFDYDILANEYEIDLLLECGFEADDLIGPLQDIDASDIGEEKDDKDKKIKKCPHCDGILN